MARWGGFVANPDPAILSADTLEEMCQPQIVADVDRWGAAWGLGFMLLRRDDRIWVGHTGGWPGAITGVFTHRESATTGVALMNATHTPDPAALATDLASAVEEREPELPAAWTPGITVPPELVPLLGVWFSEGTQFTFVVEGGTLKARVEGMPEWKAPAVFERVDENRYRTVAGRERGEWLVITRDADNVASYVRLDDGRALLPGELRLRYFKRGDGVSLGAETFLFPEGEGETLAAAGFGEAVNAWFDVAITLGPILEGYSQSLMYVAQEHATNDVAQAERAGQLADRLGGGPR